MLLVACLASADAASLPKVNCPTQPAWPPITKSQAKKIYEQGKEAFKVDPQKFKPNLPDYITELSYFNATVVVLCSNATAGYFRLDYVVKSKKYVNFYIFQINPPKARATCGDYKYEPTKISNFRWAPVESGASSSDGKAASSSKCSKGYRNVTNPTKEELGTIEWLNEEMLMYFLYNV